MVLRFDLLQNPFPPRFHDSYSLPPVTEVSHVTKPFRCDVVGASKGTTKKEKRFFCHMFFPWIIIYFFLVVVVVMLQQKEQILGTITTTNARGLGQFPCSLEQSQEVLVLPLGFGRPKSHTGFSTVLGKSLNLGTWSDFLFQRKVFVLFEEKTGRWLREVKTSRRAVPPRSRAGVKRVFFLGVSAGGFQWSDVQVGRFFFSFCQVKWCM